MVGWKKITKPVVFISYQQDTKAIAVLICLEIPSSSPAYLNPLWIQIPHYFFFSKNACSNLQLALWLVWIWRSSISSIFFYPCDTNFFWNLAERGGFHCSSQENLTVKMKSFKGSKLTFLDSGIFSSTG